MNINRQKETPTMETIIGSMDSAYFVSRQQILQWVNAILHTSIEYIEDLGSGAVYCQLVDAAFGQRVPMGKINWKAKFEYQFLTNLKIFKECLEKLNIIKHIEIEKLAKAKHQDNLTIIQWLKKYIELNGNIPQDYNPMARRNGAVLQSISQTKRNLTPILRNTKQNTQPSQQSNTFTQTTPNKKSNQPQFLKESIKVNQQRNLTQLSEQKLLKEHKLQSGTKKQQNMNIIKSFQDVKKQTNILNEISKILLSDTQPNDKLHTIEILVLGKSLLTNTFSQH